VLFRSLEILESFLDVSEQGLVRSFREAQVSSYDSGVFSASSGQCVNAIAVHMRVPYSKEAVSAVLTNVSVIDPPFLVGLGLVTAAVVAASWMPVRRSWMRWGVRGLGFGLALVMAASAVNARFAYLPTVGALLGQNATDQISPAQLRALEFASGQPLGAAGRSVSVRLAISAGSVGPELQHGVVVAITIPPTQSHFHARTAQVYLPPAYFRSPRLQLPVLELLHGTPGSPIDWTRSIYVDVTADGYASQHHGLAPILVMPDINGSWTSDSECVNGKPGQVQTYLTTDVRSAVINSFHTRRDARGWAIAGFSEGGYCALQIGLRHPNLYAAIGDFSGGEGPSVPGGVKRLFPGTPVQTRLQAASYDPAQLLHHWTGVVRPAIWFEVGTNDINLPAMAHQDLLAGARHFDTHFVAQPASTHSFAAWRNAFGDALPWFAAMLAVFGSPAISPAPNNHVTTRGTPGSQLASGRPTKAAPAQV
jgi:S-formylglutathione hydrolase FrmB